MKRKLRELYKNYGVPVFTVIMVQTPVWFVWMTELTFTYTGSNLTNGFTVFNGLQIYHIMMYVMFFSTSLAGVVIINYYGDRL